MPICGNYKRPLLLLTEAQYVPSAQLPAKRMQRQGPITGVMDTELQWTFFSDWNLAQVPIGRFDH